MNFIYGLDLARNQFAGKVKKKPDQLKQTCESIKTKKKQPIKKSYLKNMSKLMRSIQRKLISSKTKRNRSLAKGYKKTNENMNGKNQSHKINYQSHRVGKTP